MTCGKCCADPVVDANWENPGHKLTYSLFKSMQTVLAPCRKCRADLLSRIMFLSWLIPSLSQLKLPALPFFRFFCLALALFAPNFFLLFYTLIFLVIFNMCVDCARYIWIVSDHVIITWLFNQKTYFNFWFVDRFCVWHTCNCFVPRILYSCILCRYSGMRMCRYTFCSWFS